MSKLDRQVFVVGTGDELVLFFFVMGPLHVHVIKNPIYLNRGFSIEVSSSFSNFPKKILAKDGTISVPIAVPFICK